MKRAAKSPLGTKLYLENNAKKMSSKMTWPEKEFKKILKELSVKFEVQKVVDNKIFDFYIPQLNLLIEVDGDYYHANPDKVDMKTINGMQKKNIRNDNYKNSLASTLGYSLERVWENDLKVNYEIVKNRFNKILKS